MLPFTNTALFFPRLQFESNVSFSYGYDTGKKTLPLFSIDWSGKEELDKRNFEKWAKEQWPNVDLKFVPALPEKWDNYLKELLFTIPKNYLSEIRNQSQRALIERNRNYPFDTMIRDVCLEPAEAHVRVAFKLLHDCIYDEIENYYSRKDIDRYIVLPCMLYKFWYRQTGRGLLFEKSGIPKLQDYLDMFDNGTIGQNNQDEIISLLNEFINDIQEHEKYRDSVINRIYNNQEEFKDQLSNISVKKSNT